MTSLAVMGLLPPTPASRGRSSCTASELVGLPDDDMRDAARQPRSPWSSRTRSPRSTRCSRSASSSPRRSACTIPARRGASCGPAPSSCSSWSASPSPTSASDRYPHEFSGGMRQRAVIAMAVANEPEPDHRRRADHRARRDGPGPDPPGAAHGPAARPATAIMLITHDLGVVAGVADRVLVMYAGADGRAGVGRAGSSTSRATPTRRASSPPSRGWTAAAATSGSTRSGQPPKPTRSRPAAGSGRAARTSRPSPATRPTRGRRPSAPATSRRATSSTRSRRNADA